MKNFMVLLLSIFSTMVVAESKLLVEKRGQELHFVYPNLEADDAYYYAMWTNGKKGCEKADLDSKALVLSNASNKLYRLPEKGGLLCLQRSDKFLDVNWDRFQIRVDNKLLKIDADDSRGVGDIEPQPIIKPETKKCKFDSNKISTCKIKL